MVGVAGLHANLHHDCGGVENLSYLFASVARCLQLTVQGRIEVAFSRSNRAYTGASVQYVPKETKATTRVLLDSHGALLGLTKSGPGQSSAASAASNPTLSAGLRQRHREQPGLQKQDAARLKDDADLDRVEPVDPLQWFGQNASPSIIKAQAMFRSAVAIAVQAANARRKLTDAVS